MGLNKSCLKLPGGLLLLHEDLSESSSPTETTTPNIACWSKCKRQCWKNIKIVLHFFSSFLKGCCILRHLCICPSGSVIPSVINTTQPFSEAPGLSWGYILVWDILLCASPREAGGQVSLSDDCQPPGDPNYVTLSSGLLLVSCIVSFDLAVYSCRQQGAARTGSCQTQ